MEVITDIKKSTQINNRYLNSILNKVSDYDYQENHVDGPTCMGDINKYTVDYQIGDFMFKYSHMCSEGQIFGASFLIARESDQDQDQDQLLEQTRDDAMLSLVVKKVDHLEDISLDILKEFLVYIEAKESDQINEVLTVLGILNSFTLGHSTNPVWVDNIINQEYFYLYDYLNTDSDTDSD